MLLKKKQDAELDIKKINDSVSILHRILKIGYILFIILAIYVFIILSKELKIMDFILTLLKVLAPLFIGVLVTWLFNPFVSWLGKKGINRVLGSTIAYLLLIAFFALMLSSIIPVLSDQTNDLVRVIPQIFDTIQGWIDGIFSKLDNIGNIDVMTIRDDLFSTIESFGSELTASLPNMIVTTITAIFSGLGIILLGLVIGFYLLISFDGTDPIVSILPKRFQGNVTELLSTIDDSLRSWVQGALIASSYIFVLNAIGFSLVGLRAPLFFALFCAVTNVIPYIGPWIGGFPAVIVGFSQSMTIGFLTLLIVFVLQTLDGSFVQPLIMSKATKLHPVTIILGLLIFGYFFGIMGMLVSTPVIVSVKAVILFFDEKYNFLSFDD